jgi:hypothetical protein
LALPSQSAVFWSFSNATTTWWFGRTTGTENWFSSHSPGSLSGPGNVQIAAFEPEIRFAADHVKPPSSLWDS